MLDYNKSGSIDWKTEIVIGVRILQRMSEVDYENLWEYHLPEVRATIEQVESTEEKLGFRLPEDYRTFLLHANGWKCFFQHVNIFSLENLTDSTYISNIMDIVQIMTGNYLEEVNKFDLNTLLPIAANKYTNDIFVMIKPGNPGEGMVIWLANGEIDKFESFYEFYLSMLDYNRFEIKILKSEAENAQNKR